MCYNLSSSVGCLGSRTLRLLSRHTVCVWHRTQPSVGLSLLHLLSSARQSLNSPLIDLFLSSSLVLHLSSVISSLLLSLSLTVEQQQQCPGPFLHYCELQFPGPRSQRVKTLRLLTIRPATIFPNARLSSQAETTTAPLREWRGTGQAEHPADSGEAGLPWGHSERSPPTPPAIVMSVVTGGSGTATHQPMSNKLGWSQVFVPSATLRKDRPHWILSLPGELHGWSHATCCV